MNIVKFYFSKIVIFATIISLLFLFSCNQKNAKKRINLNEGWEFCYPKTEKWYPASVPGNIHTDLFTNKLISDPFYDTNSDSLEWISEETWHYRKDFTIETEFHNRNLEIVFDGLDTYAEIFLNDKLLGIADNMYKQWVFQIDDSIKKKENTLEVVFYPSKNKNMEMLKQVGYALPDSRIFTRKAPFQYGWDWAPKIETCGIYKDVYINTWKKLRITNANIEQNILEDTIAYLTAKIELESENYYNGNVKIISPTGEFDTIDQKLEIYEGKQIYPIEFSIKNPQLWWCNGMGKQKLYDIKIQVSTKFRVEEKNLRTGLRKIELNTNTDNFGQEFYIILNGIPVFSKGANWVPAEYFSGSNNYENYKDLLVLAKEANFNMLRVWGGGIYENDEFYEICDSLGIMVWQDLMFSCAMYPGDSAFTENVSEEVNYQVNRLYNHPSIVLWCGNNEGSNAWFDWGWQKQYAINEQDSAKIWKDYDNLFHRLIPKIISKIDKSRKYIPSSPFYGWGHKESNTHGDSHYWGVWWGMKDFNEYYNNTGRFMSEYGFQAFPVMSSIKKFIPSDSLYMYSESLKTHQKHSFGYDAIEEYMKREYIVPTNFEDFVYVSQIVQAEGLQKAFDAHLSAMPYCMGSLFWQFNDCWPVVSWSAVDYYKQPKALYFFAKKAFENVSIAIINNDEIFKVFVVNQLNKSINSKLIVRICDFNGNILQADSIITILPLFASSEINFSQSTKDYFSKKPENIYAEFELIDNNLQQTITTRSIVIAQNKNLKLPVAEFHYNSLWLKDHWEISISSKTFVKNLYVYTENQLGKFSDNYFNLLPNKLKIVNYFPDKEGDDLILKFKSMNQINNDSVE